MEVLFLYLDLALLELNSGKQGKTDPHQTGDINLFFTWEKVSFLLQL
jgi:hypothetical protein